MVKEVMLIFKTHLDIGYTDLACNVIEKYINKFVPAAVNLAYKQRNTDYTYVWTTGSWLIDEALKTDDGTLKNAIKDGLIHWHAMPFTAHTELMNEELLQYGLSLSAKLDNVFGRTTIAAKMTDVPGHTIGIVPQLSDAGIKLLHIGVNPATPMPEVPEIFRWKCGGDSIAVMYNKGYGDFFEFGETAVGFGVTNDNLGPHTVQELEDYYNYARKKYPGAYVHAASLNDVAVKIENLALPVIEDEIGDTWIHGMGTDPYKTSAYRAILRNRAGELHKYDITDNLLLVPEHTWGSNVQVKFPDTGHYLLKDFEGYQSAERSFMESTWKEQREYVERAAKILDFNLEEEMKIVPPCLDGAVQTQEECGLEISYQLFDKSDYERYAKKYFDSKLDWAVWDFSKPGLPDYKGGIFTAKVISAVICDAGAVYTLAFDSDIAEFCGLPMFYVIKNDNNYEVQWHGKKANRLSEAFWLKFKGLEENWELHKMGLWLKPPAKYDSPLLHAVWRGVRNTNTEIVSTDALLAAPFGRHLLDYGCSKEEDLYFNLYNNVWNTNFPLWYCDNAKFRFQLLQRENTN